MARLREGRANTARGAAHFLRETVARVRAAGASGQLMRADSGFYNHAVVAVCRKQDVRLNHHSPAAERTHDRGDSGEDWTPIPYWLGRWRRCRRDDLHAVPAQGGRRPGAAYRRRVKPTPGSLALFTSYHAFIIRAAGAGGRPSPHAEIENAIRDLYGVGLHLPSGRFAANAAWLAVQVIAHNLARWTARLGLGEGIVTTRSGGATSLSPDGSPTRPGAGPCTSRSAGPGLASGQPPWRDYGRYRSRPDARSQRRPGSKARHARARAHPRARALSAPEPR